MKQIVKFMNSYDWLSFAEHVDQVCLVKIGQVFET
jgi:hypothetical protein